MPVCSRHNIQMVTNVNGVATCEQCERESRADVALHCAICNTPVPTPGLCPDCALLARRESGVRRLGANAYWFILLAFAIGAWILYPYVRDFVKAAAAVGQR